MRKILLLVVCLSSHTLVAGGITSGGLSASGLIRTLTNLASQLEATHIALMVMARSVELDELLKEKADYIQQHGETIDEIEELKSYELKHFKKDTDTHEMQEVLRTLDYFIPFIKREPSGEELAKMKAELESELEALLEKIRNN